MPQLLDEMPRAVFAEDVEEPVPVGDVEGLDDLGCAVGEYCGASKVCERGTDPVMACSAASGRDAASQ
jgi:hypothetical protein